MKVSETTNITTKCFNWDCHLCEALKTIVGIIIKTLSNGKTSELLEHEEMKGCRIKSASRYLKNLPSEEEQWEAFKGEFRKIME